MKSTMGGLHLPDNNKRLIEDVFHELRSILSSILSSVELIELYADNTGKERLPASEKINRQAGAIKMQVVELEYQLQNVKIIQHILNNSLNPRKVPGGIVRLLKGLFLDERYQALFNVDVVFNVNREPADMLVDEALLKQLVLNILFRMEKNAASGQEPVLTFNFEDTYFEIKGEYTAASVNHFVSSSIKTGDQEKFSLASSSPEQGISYLMAYVARLHGGTFDITAAQERSIEILVKIPYKP
ncbi:hypothetical protein MKQ68_19880 [Chitinophaga horti]|uniref:HAMP domain-containing histidine kinase n=1 Tax=Chitinophaga horti TaxID=2920382 RepID=A0ABY6J142_9BACT|nr:hypothetical protein [Chitinophaga horti]UYQ92347.1 hypothetical protein MKQ68_19880 [Chitinophaga horti]